MDDSEDSPYTSTEATDGNAFAPPVTVGTGPTQDEKTMGLVIHLLGLFTGFLGPLIIWLIKKDESPFLERHGRKSLNFEISFMIYMFGCGILMILIIPIFLAMALAIAGLVFRIQNIMRAANGEEGHYPLAIPFIKAPM